MKNYTMVGRQHHTVGLVGNVYRIVKPESINIGHCFLRGRLKAGDLFYCQEHAGDRFQNYVYIWEGWNQLIYQPEHRFGAYGIGDSVKVSIPADLIDRMVMGEYIQFSLVKS
jgi:hypothetical protein